MKMRTMVRSGDGYLGSVIFDGTNLFLGGWGGALYIYVGDRVC